MGKDYAEHVGTVTSEQSRDIMTLLFFGVALKTSASF